MDAQKNKYAAIIADEQNALVYKERELYLEDVALKDIAAKVGTPVYCYSTSALTRNFLSFKNACDASSPLICFAVKANSNLAILRLLASLGSGADVVSEGELRKAIAAGIQAEKIVFAGVGKKPAEIRFAITAGIAQFNVESEAELETIAKESKALGKQAPIALRINPDVDAGTNTKVTTGTRHTKFGIPASRMLDVYSQLCANPWLIPRGLSVHIGSQLTSLGPFKYAFDQVIALVRDLRRLEMPVDTIDLGGGLGVTYDSEEPPSFNEYGELIQAVTAELDCELILEPGRCLVATAGVLLSEVILNKSQESRSIVVLDAALNDLLRPGLYEAYHKIVPVRTDASSRPSRRVDYVGPICETSDTFCLDEEATELATGDLVAILTTGAYGAVMASTYNTRPLVPEVLVRGTEFEVIRRRESYAEMLNRDVLPSWMADV